jgi:hypothetical protein
MPATSNDVQAACGATRPCFQSPLYFHLARVTTVIHTHVTQLYIKEKVDGATTIRLYAVLPYPFLGHTRDAGAPPMTPLVLVVK